MRNRVGQLIDSKVLRIMGVAGSDVALEMLHLAIVQNVLDKKDWYVVAPDVVIAEERRKLLIKVLPPQYLYRLERLVYRSHVTR